jgi:hypothetical protein
VGWGEPARFSEFDSNGRMIFDYPTEGLRYLPSLPFPLAA